MADLASGYLQQLANSSVLQTRRQVVLLLRLLGQLLLAVKCVQSTSRQSHGLERHWGVAQRSATGGSMSGHQVAAMNSRAPAATQSTRGTSKHGACR
jgi:hypothetical protein